MGGLLRQKKKRRSDWENVLNDSIWSVSWMPEHLNYAIYLSYQDLPSSLRPCFLHFSLLPKSTEFNVNAIVGMWISEGFVHGSSHELEKLGREYYDELILRNLIEPDIGHVDHVVCSMHDVIRSFAQYVTRDEALAAQSSKLNMIGKHNSKESIRRISVESKRSESEQLEWASLQTYISLRTLILVGPIKINPGDSLVNFSGLRTLHIQDTTFGPLVESLVRLKHLRYLSIMNSNTAMLPEKIGSNVKFLQYIRLFGCQHLVNLPSSIGKLRHLRYLNLNGSRINNVPKGFSGLTNLRKLYGFPAHMDGDWCSLEELGPLTNLIALSINYLENMSSSLFARKARLCEKVSLGSLILRCSNRHGDDGMLAGRQQINEVFDELCPPPSLELLEIKGYFGQRLPRWMMEATSGTLGSLSYLFMGDLPYCTEVPDNLCQLPCLEYQQIKSAPLIKSIGPEYVQPDNNELPSGLENFGFAVKLVVENCPSLVRIGNLPNTKELRIVNCPNLKTLDGMPALRRITLEDNSMKTLPGYLQDVNPKQLLETMCDISLLTSIAVGKSGIEWAKFCHVGQVKAYADDVVNNIRRKWYVVHTRNPFSFKTNISHADNTQGSLL